MSKLRPRIQFRNKDRSRAIRGATEEVTGPSVTPLFADGRSGERNAATGKVAIYVERGETEWKVIMQAGQGAKQIKEGKKEGRKKRSLCAGCCLGRVVKTGVD